MSTARLPRSLSELHVSAEWETTLLTYLELPPRRPSRWLVLARGAIVFTSARIATFVFLLVAS
ncbi:hypothetical protein [Luteibacter sp. dw_328]|uniref:hypothetical protein n=1 Tax=Luteibacter sp. dw_328 TaxID=2719796 RepID=UPI001BD40A42|nr:hypothetical protein [Luteibacter sp. dw_328]